jgi:putative ABC transport system permease protein
MNTAPRPPGVARWMLQRVLPREARDAAEGDLFQLYAERHASRGAASARLWYWCETLSFCARFSADRVRRVRLLPTGSSIPSALDLKLGARMLVKYPGLAIVGGLGIAIGTALGAGAHAWVNGYMYPPLPLEDGDRIVAISNVDMRGGVTLRPRLHDFAVWRAELRSLVDLGAFRTASRNLVTPDGPIQPVAVAEMSASGFRVARVPPLLGRVFEEADEQTGAAGVMVIGYDVWQRRFAADARVIGHTLRLGADVHTIVGVMPAEFGFPVSDSYWVPLRMDPSGYEFGRAPEIIVFGRLAPGATKEDAQAELTVVGSRTAAAHPGTHESLRPHIAHYRDALTGGEGAGALVTVVQLTFILLLALICTNVAILVYARTVTRAGEIAVRTALGATRGRIVTQLFAEAFVLSAASALAGLGFAAGALRFAGERLANASPTGRLPFWVDMRLSFDTIAYTLLLATIAAIIVGVLPAVKATGAQLKASLGNLSGGARAQLGRTWTVLIVAQVAVTVSVLPVAFLLVDVFRARAMQTPGFPADEVLVVGARADDGSRTNGEASAQRRLIAALESEPGVRGITVSAGAPGDDSAEALRIQIEGASTDVRVRTSHVDPNYFSVFQVKAIVGRLFSPSDLNTPARPVIVNRSFVTDVLGGVEPVGRRVRARAEDGDERPWHTIVGVVDDFPTGFTNRGLLDAKMFYLIAAGERAGDLLLVRLQAETPGDFTPRLREIAMRVDPTLQLHQVRALDDLYTDRRRTTRTLAIAFAVGVGSILLLSTAGMYALMSFAVNQRRREIGVRAALGADARRILTGILGRAALQLALGVVVGLGFAVVLERLTDGEVMGGNVLVLVPAIALFMALTGLLAAAGPARRALRVQLTDALRAE